MDFDAMEAGREMDALVAERVMEMRPAEVYHVRERGGYQEVSDDCPAFSNDRALALYALEKVACDYHIERSAHVEAGRRYSVRAMVLPRHTSAHKSFEAEGPTLPLAACRVALKASAALKRRA